MISFKALGVRLRSRLGDEHGAISTFLAAAIVVLLVITLAIMVPVGDFVADRRNANTSADAAALAGAGFCADRLEDAYQSAVTAVDGWGFWAQFGRPVSTYCTGISAEAARFAKENDADLTGFKPLSGLRFRASTRMDDVVQDTDVHATSTATARMDIEEGLCVSGGLVGVFAEGRCQTVPMKFNPETGEPLRPVGYSSTARVDTRLVAS